ncbi:MAG: hypothetical protein M1840_007311 [Geoglossum simile]|nr:MAG: hypothetical protein M1840_007311 [Geoglossum simile]
MPEGLNRCSLQVRYEISRVALECSIPINELSAPSPIPDEYGEMWSWLQRICQRRGKSPPERSNAKAWELANGQFENVALTGDLSFNTSKRNLSSTNDDPIFLFRLNPLKVESSCRLFRRFGSDRFIVISLPVMSSLPTRWKVDRNAFRESILNWLVKGRHKFLGREWKAFYLKYSKRKGDSSTTNKWLIYFFAIDGCDFHEGTKPPAKGEPVGKHSRMELGEMLEWFMPFTPNQGKPCCKAFARLQLAVSQTRSTLVFRPEEIIRVPDILGDTAAGSTERKVMNDGCSRISRPAARAIAEMLCISGATPSAFQGRIAGAKGLWMVDPSEDPSPTVDNRGFWIEITDSQLKFEGHSIDLYQPDNDRVTIEINSWSQPLKAASLNFQLIPILECQGVPRDVIKKRLEEDLKSRISGLMESLEDPVAFRKWNHDANGSANERLRNQGVQFLGGLPASETEQINWFLESGFDPGTCAFLRNLAWKLAMGYCDRLKKKMHIGVGQSTYAFCLADPLGVLEEGEVHFGFSTTFRDPGSSFEDTMLHGIDVLVARLPAALPSDVQKVRAVFKPELRLLKDVIVFSTKGSTPLADKLSGGDYDGDRVWVCWDPEFVRDFENAPVPEQKPLQQRLEYYGISQDKLRLADLPKDLDERTTQFIYRGFQAELGEGMLGICTQFHEKFCYRDNSINTPGAVDLAILLGLLVDSAKQGYVFSEDSWICFRRKISPQVPLKPAYQENDESIQTDHIIDHLVFQVAKPTVDNVLTEFNARFPEQNTRDGDLVRLWREEKESSKQDKKLQRVLSRLEEDIRGIGDFWAIYPRSSNFTDRVSRAYTKFNDIMPMDIDHPLVRRWSEDANRSPVSHWRLLRASAIIGKYTKVAWWVAGRELGQLKAMASGGFHMVVTPIHASYKPDSNYVRKANIGRLTGVDVEVESVMGDEWEGEFESVFEYGDWPDEVCEAREPFW